MNKNVRKMMAALLALVMILLAGCGGKNAPAETVSVTEQVVATEAPETTEVTQAPTVPQLTVESIEEQGDMMVVNTPYFQLRYPFAFADLIQVEAQTAGEVEELIFTAKLDLSEYRLFSLILGGTGDILLGTVMLPQREEPVAVYATLYRIDENLSSDFVNTFNAAQECFNDVMMSLMECEGFTPAE